jgi:hypothetical protein
MGLSREALLWLLLLLLPPQPVPASSCANSAGFKEHNYIQPHAYAPWRARGTPPPTLGAWAAAQPIPVPAAVAPAALRLLPRREVQASFAACLTQQSENFTMRVLTYQSPRLEEVAAAVRAELDRRGARAAAVVFWGRHRCEWGRVLSNRERATGRTMPPCNCACGCDGRCARSVCMCVSSCHGLGGGR